ncbi:hypothetical protein FDP41_012607 [Naegleria fowleri]|uniref:Uncharacterized protein n=1 Tax=Naegleria fowleri TaxID=5763 RepID=A0A6A5BVU5_NAEFO|nr:uncharacterized protein FDP41_012607 [Naegleria fowleri]KAF0981347.1 hypothetical protein FDP41_012607 [Naegleria fowleri]CAG4709708.1 unnamed protein product [Naegleria fowleri]
MSSSNHQKFLLHDWSSIEHAYFELNKALNLKIQQLEQYELRLQERERELNRRELLLIEKYGSDSVAATVSSNHHQDGHTSRHENNDLVLTQSSNQKLNEHDENNIFTVTQFDINFTSNKMKIFNSSGVIKHYVDDQSCACMGIVEGNYDNYDVIRFKVKLGNNCEGLFLGFASQDDFYLSGKNYFTCAWMIQIILRDQKIHLVKFSPQQEFEGGEEMTNESKFLEPVQTLFGMGIEMRYHVKKGMIELGLNEGELFNVFNGLEKNIQLFPAFETRLTNCQFEFDSSR